MASFKHREQVVLEIIETEKVYLRCLDALLDFYGAELKQSNLLNQTDYNIVFSDVGVIRNTSRALLEDLEMLQNEKSGMSLGQIFLKYVPLFRTYSSYCNKYDNINTIVVGNPGAALKTFLRQLRKRAPNCQSLDQLSITIVQRLPRYNLLLNEALKVTPKLHKDYESLAQALQQMKAAAETVNERMREFERRARLLHLKDQIQGLPFDLVQPSRIFALEADLFVLRPLDVAIALTRLQKEQSQQSQQSGSSPRSASQTAGQSSSNLVELLQEYERHVFLFNNLLTICTRIAENPTATTVTDDTDGPVYRYESHIHLNDESAFPWIAERTNSEVISSFDAASPSSGAGDLGAALRLTPAEDEFFALGFILVASENLYLAARTESDRNNWIDTILEQLEFIASSNQTEVDLRKRRALLRLLPTTGEALAAALEDAGETAASKEGNQSRRKKGLRSLTVFKKSDSGSSDNNLLDKIPSSYGNIVYPFQVTRGEGLNSVPTLAPSEISLFKERTQEQCVAIVRALYSYEPRPTANASSQLLPKGLRKQGESDELKFSAGDVLIVHQKNIGPDKHWWIASKVGLSVDPVMRRQMLYSSSFDELKEQEKTKRRTARSNSSAAALVSPRGGQTPSSSTGSGSSTPQRPLMVTRKNAAHCVNLNMIDVPIELVQLPSAGKPDLTSPPTSPVPASELKLNLVTSSTDQQDAAVKKKRGLTLLKKPSKKDSSGAQEEHSGSSSPVAAGDDDSVQAPLDPEAEQALLTTKTISTWSEAGETGVIPCKYFQEFSAAGRELVLKLAQQCQRQEERKIRSFSIKKSSPGNTSLLKLKSAAEASEQSQNELEQTMLRRKQLAEGGGAGSDGKSPSLPSTPIKSPFSTPVTSPGSAFSSPLSLSPSSSAFSPGAGLSIILEDTSTPRAQSRGVGRKSPASLFGRK